MHADSALCAVLRLLIYSVQTALLDRHTLNFEMASKYLVASNHIFVAIETT